MQKHQRLNAFLQKLTDSDGASSVDEARALMRTLIASVEAVHAPAGETHMTVPEPGGGPMRTFNDGGVLIHLNAHLLYINPTGAIGIVRYEEMETLWYTRPAADGTPFVPMG